MWPQAYSPILDSVTFSAIVALLPIALMFILLGSEGTFLGPPRFNS